MLKWIKWPFGHKKNDELALEINKIIEDQQNTIMGLEANVQALNWSLAELQLAKEEYENNSIRTIICMLLELGGELVVTTKTMEMANESNVYVEFNPNQDGSVTMTLATPTESEKNEQP